MNRVWFRFLLAAIALALAACTAVDVMPIPVETPLRTDAPGPTNAPTEPAPSGKMAAPGELIQSSEPRDVDPGVSEADVVSLADDNAEFAFDLYRYLGQGEGNLFFSPHSISVALAMTYAGARYETERQMAEALCFALPQERLHPAFNALDQALESRGEAAAGKDDEGFRLNIVNAIWGQEGYDFLQPYLEVLARNYGAGLRVLDFVSAPDASRVEINEWVSEQTEGRIEDLIPPGAIDALTRLVLTNAIYFNAAWAVPFEPEQTEDGRFTLHDGTEVSVPMMRQSERMAYVSGEGYQAVELPYDGHELSMVILLPEEGEFLAFEQRLDAEAFSGVIDSLEMQQVKLSMPKFEYESEFGLETALVGLGMEQAFTAAADFSGMTGARELFISDVIHKAFVSVDEAGTEAAAATAVVMRLTAAGPEEPIELSLDHPFVFAIHDLRTGAVLFIGRVVDPR